MKMSSDPETDALNTTLELTELNEKIGQLFMIGIPGMHLDKQTAELIRTSYVGGVILFSRNIEDPLQLAELCRDLQDTAMKAHGTPLFLSVDQEGGRVARLKEPFTVFPGNRAMGSAEDPLAQAEHFGQVTAREMGAVGLNMDLAPVLDVQLGEPEKHLEGRLFGEDPRMVARLGTAVIKALQVNGIMAVAKHFPGLGRATLDPHLKLPIIQTGPSEIEEINLPPFKAAIAEGVSAVMTSHALYPDLDPDRPATLSPIILTSLLRRDLKFDGLIITDDLEMGAIAENQDVAQGAVDAFEAGADILLICKEQERYLESLDLLRRRMMRGEIPYPRLHQSNRRIAEAKSRFLTPLKTVSLTAVKEMFRLA